MIEKISLTRQYGDAKIETYSIQNDEDGIIYLQFPHEKLSYDSGNQSDMVSMSDNTENLLRLRDLIDAFIQMVE